MPTTDLRQICHCGRNNMGAHGYSPSNGCPREPVAAPCCNGTGYADFAAVPCPNPTCTAAPSEHDPVRPTHYYGAARCQNCDHPIECIDVTAHMNFPVGSAVKYLWRLDLKGDPIEQLCKARQFIDFEIARRERNASTP